MGTLRRPPAGQPYGGAPAVPRNGIGILALVLGIMSIPLLFISIGILGIVLGGVALILGIIGVRRAGRRKATNGGVAVAGIVTGALGLLIGVVVLIFAIVFINVGTGCMQFGSDGSQAEVECLQDPVNN